MTNRREFLATLTMAAGAVTLLKPLNSFAHFGQPVPAFSPGGMLTILHTANLRGQRQKLGKQDPLVELGGLHNISLHVDAIRREGITVLLVDAGNMRSATHYRNEESLLYYQQLGRIQYDAVIPGETDLANGNDYFNDLAAQSHLRVLPLSSKNVHSEVIVKGGMQVGLIAIKATTLSVRSSSFISVLNETAADLKQARGCTLVIVLAQGTHKNCTQLAARSSAIDVIATSHENNSLHNTHILRNAVGHEVVLSTAGSKGVMMSRIDIQVNSSGEKVAISSKAVIGGCELAATEVLKKYTALQC